MPSFFFATFHITLYKTFLSQTTMTPMETIIIKPPRRKARIGVLPTRKEKSKKDRERERKPKHPKKEVDA